MNAETLAFSKDVAASINPATGECFAEYPYQSPAQLDCALAVAHAGYRKWAAWQATARSQAIASLGQLLLRDKQQLARVATLEMGKPISQAIAEIEKCANLCQWYSEHGPAMLQDRPTPIGPDAYVSYLPIGPVLAVMPWNFPYWQILRGAIPIVLAGNSYVLKHAPNVQGCARALLQLFSEAGFPEGVFSVINVPNDLVSVAIRDRRVAAVAVTGSVRAGAAIAAQAGAALKKTLLELGGSDPFVVLADANVDRAVEAAVVGRFQNTGQICIAAKRIILEAPIAKEFTRKFVDKVAQLECGDPLKASTYIGPMARADLRDELAQQVRRSVEAGATVLYGGGKGTGPGAFHEPTVLAGVRPGMAAFQEETFGPLAALIEAADEDDALRLANDSEFGLSGAIWTERKDVAKSLARKFETGGIFVNSFSASDPRIPIGGVKNSGYGRELSHFGVHEFVNAQTVWFERT